MILAHPCPVATLSDRYGPRKPLDTDSDGRPDTDGFHDGQDYAAPGGTPIRAAAAGVVALAGRAGGYGYAVYLDHGDGLTTRYAHMMAPPPVGRGWHVSAGQVIGYVGSTGDSTGNHLHFETRIYGESIDPLRLLAAPTTKKGRPKMATMIRTPDGSIGFVSDAGMLDPISNIEEVEALKASGLVSGWVNQPDRLVWNLLAARTKRLQDEEAARIAAAIKASK